MMIFAVIVGFIYFRLDEKEVNVRTVVMDRCVHGDYQITLYIYVETLSLGVCMMVGCSLTILNTLHYL